MNKKKLIIILSAGILCIILLQQDLKAPLATHKPDTGKDLQTKINKKVFKSKLLAGNADSLITGTLKNAFKHLGYSLVFPFTPEVNNVKNNLATAKIIATENTSKKMITFNNLTNQMPESATSSFTCPPQVPYAIAYTLESATKDITIYNRIYRNTCDDDIKLDLLYGENQIVSSSGDAANLAGFIPSFASNGCPYHDLLDAKITESALLVSPIVETTNNESMIIGFRQSTNINIDCNKLCNHMINNLCAVDWNYCNETIIASYYKENIYQVAKIKEYYCACSIQGQYEKFTFTFTNAIDVESLINYSNRLNSVTCTNYPPESGTNQETA